MAEVSHEIAVHLRQGGTLGAITRFLHRKWLPLLDAPIGGRHRTSVDDFEAINKIAIAKTQRKRLCDRWKRQLDGHDAELSLESIASPEEYCRQFVPRFQQAIVWYDKVGREIDRCLGHIGTHLADYVNVQPAQPGPQPMLRRWLSACGHLLPVLARQLIYSNCGGASNNTRPSLSICVLLSQTVAPDSVAERLLQAVTPGRSGSLFCRAGSPG